MLGRLVNKFKRQTLQDGAGGGSPAQLSPPPLRDTGTSGQVAATRRSARLNEKAEKERCEGVDIINSSSVSLAISTSPPNTRARRAQLEAAVSVSEQHEQQKFSNQSTFGGNNQFGGVTTTILARSPHRPLAFCDSGTESSDDEEDDEELEMLDSLSNASRAAIEEGIIGRSPPTLTSSPPLISEIETSSWDSCGCESGIVLRDSAERDDASRNVDLLEAALGGSELVLDNINGKKKQQIIDEIIGGTTPIQSKDAFPAHFNSSSSCCITNNRTLPLPIDFSALRQSELFGSSIILSDDTPTPIGSHKTSGQGAALMEMAIEENRVAKNEQNEQQQPIHQGAFRRVLRRNRRNSNSQTNTTTNTNNNCSSVLASRTISPFGLGEKRRWGDQNVLNDNNCQLLIQQQQQPERSETPIAGRTRSMLMANNTMMLLGNGNNIDSSNNDRQVLTAARRTRVRILYSSSSSNQQKSVDNNGGISSSSFHQITTIHGRRGQVAPILGQSPPYMLANKRGRHSNNNNKNGGSSPPRPSLNFDKMRKRMLSNVSNNFNELENLTLNENIKEKNGTD